MLVRPIRRYNNLLCGLRSYSNDAIRDKRFDILFCGSDSFSVSSLQALLGAQDIWKSIHVLVPGEQDVGRGGKSRSRHVQIYKSELGVYAERHGLPIYTVPKEGIRAFVPPNPFTSPNPTSLLLTVSFGHILPSPLLSLFPPYHRLNLHPSLLPKFRGAAPIQHTILTGVQTTGVTLQRLVERGKGIDAGDILGITSPENVCDSDTYSTLLPRLAIKGADLLVETLRKVQDGKAESFKQDEKEMTRAPKIRKEMGRVKWEKQGAKEVERLYRGIGHQQSLWTEVVFPNPLSSPTSNTTNFSSRNLLKSQDVNQSNEDSPSQPDNAISISQSGLTISSKARDDDAKRQSSTAYILQLTSVQLAQKPPPCPEAKPGTVIFLRSRSPPVLLVKCALHSSSMSSSTQVGSSLRRSSTSTETTTQIETTDIMKTGETPKGKSSENSQLEEKGVEGEKKLIDSIEKVQGVKQTDWIEIRSVKPPNKPERQVGEWWNGLPPSVRAGNEVRFV
ncbi:hypothetical protein M231_02513 [Tremella mesenterica]|uniref:methionyl-tRNA formyltransferase n=1 Tax=Tremella mesenterica TaxID=5217 RepID=A0A4Q1BQM6_TREME|nr:hypothetical protein M231_02513 [Tremella mesenterica]